MIRHVAAVALATVACVIAIAAPPGHAARADDARRIAQATPPPRQPSPAPAQPTRAEIEAIQRKVQRAWTPPADARDIQRLQVDLRVALDADGTVLAVSAVDQARLARDDLFRRAAESAEAAVRRASPLPVPRDKSQFFKQFVMRFAPPPARGRAD